MKWEYRFAPADAGELNELGGEEWELAGLIGTITSRAGATGGGLNKVPSENQVIMKRAKP